MRLLYEQLGDLPVGFTEVEYLESSGTQYIDIGLNGKNGYDFDYKFNSTRIDSTAYGIGGEWESNKSCYLGLIRNTNKFAYHYQNTSSPIEVQTLTANIDYRVQAHLYSGEQYYIINGTKSAVGTITGTFESTTSMNLFRVNSSSPIYSYIKVNYLKIWDNGVLIRDFVPCLDNNNVPCMYDKVEKKAYYNAGTGSFTYGRKIIPIEYLQFNGNQYIQTNFNTTNATSFKYEVKFDLSSNVTNAEPRVFSNEGTGTGKYFDIYYVVSSDKLICRPPAAGISLTAEKAAVFKYSTTVGKIQGYYEDTPNTLIYDSNATFTAPTVNINYKIGSRGNNAASQYLWQGKIYYVYFERENLVCDFVPVKDENGVGYLFDKSAHTLYANAGSGSFTCGPEIPNKKVRFLVDGYNRLPKGYTEVEYLKSDGLSLMYITPDLSYFPDFEVGVKCDANSDRNATLGVDGNNMLERSSASNPYWTLHTSGTIFMSNVGVGTYADAKYKDGVFSVNGVTVGTKENTFQSGTLCLFKPHTGNNNLYKMSIYFFKAWDSNGNLVRDLIPCLDANNTPCMYDRVTKTAFYNQGIGNFSVGSKIIPIEYIENTGTQYLDTGYDMADIRQIDMAVNWSAHTDTRREIMGSATSGGYSFEVSATGYYGLGASNYSNVLAEKTDLLSWRYVVTERPQLYRNGQLICTDTLIRVPVGTFKTAIADSWATHSKIYWFKIYTNNGVMVRDYIAVRNENNVGYMLDTVTHRLYGNVLTGTFVLGPDLKINTLRLVQDAVPTAYKRLNYIESSGAQYIDTGIIGAEGVLSEIDVMKTTATTNECFLGTWNSGSARCWLAYAFSNKWYPGYGGAASDMVSVVQNSWTHIKTYITQVSTRKYFGYNVNGTDYTLTGYFTSFTGQNTILMFAMNTNTGANYKATGRIGTCKITKDGVLVRDFVPVLRKSDNKAGMYDLITKQFYGNLGTGDFTYG